MNAQKLSRIQFSAGTVFFLAFAQLWSPPTLATPSAGDGKGALTWVWQTGGSTLELTQSSHVDLSGTLPKQNGCINDHSQRNIF